MRVKVISRSTDEFTRERSNDLQRVFHNFDPSLRTQEKAVEYVRALNAAKLDKVFARPFIGAMDGHVDAVSCMAKNPNYLKGVFSGSVDGEIMGIECLTRHNIASHLQKYRSHRKHVLARESEAASWNHQRRHMYGGGKSESMSPWLVSGPSMGFPPPMAPRPVQPLFRPLHVWGHPSADQSAWPRHIGALSVPPASPPRPGWPPGYPPYSLPPSSAQPMDHNAHWIPHHHPVPNVVTPGRPHFAQPRSFTGLMPGSPVPGIPPNAMYKVDPGIGVPASQSVPQPPQDFHPSRGTIDAAIGDALAKPWEPLPLGLKAPSVDGVLAELHRQGIANIPPSSTS